MRKREPYPVFSQAPYNLPHIIKSRKYEKNESPRKFRAKTVQKI